MNVLFLAAEAEPFVKVGGLGDVAGSLPRAIRSLSEDFTSGITPDVRLVLPLHPAIREARPDLRPSHVFAVAHGSGSTTVRVFGSDFDGMPVYLLDAPQISSSGSVYASDSNLDGAKYSFFSIAALELARTLNWRVDVVHANDWHTALSVYALHLQRQKGETSGTATVLTVHNLPFMGPTIAALLTEFGLRRAKTGLPDWASARPLALGLWAADAIVAVSPTYAREIQSAKSGAGLHQYLRARRNSLHGILNGIDLESFNPATDTALAVNYGAPTLELRKENKLAIQGRFNLPQEDKVLVLGVVSRLDRQKGTDLIPATLRRLPDVDWQLIVLGTGQPRLEESLQGLRRDFPEKVRVEIAYDGRLARQIYAGADALLMPSRYEPCGLAQMIAMRYGCIPVVSAVGGLVDTVADGITGIVMGPATATRLASAIRKAAGMYRDTAAWISMQRAAMAQDFSWSASARKYFELYTRVVSDAQVAAQG